MNIFILDADPVKAAEQQCDKHVVKMCLETAQLLCTALHVHGTESQYKPTHKNHPCTKWASESRANYLWLCAHGLALCSEYTARYKKQHKCQSVIVRAKELSGNIPQGPLTPFVQAMPDEYRHPDTIKAYRNYYTGEKLRFATWKRNAPEWAITQGG